MSSHWMAPFLSPQRWVASVNRYVPWLAAVGWIILGVGLYAGLYLAPTDSVQRDAFRLIYVHVPCAFLSLGLYLSAALLASLHWVFKWPVWDALAESTAQWGAVMTLLALITGAIWGQPMWGTWWVWDARLTSELLLLFLYWGYLALRQTLQHASRDTQAATLLILVGLINLPIIHWSVTWWQTLHQGPTLGQWGKPAMAWPMLWPLLCAILGCSLVVCSGVLMRSRRALIGEHRS